MLKSLLTGLLVFLLAGPALAAWPETWRSRAGAGDLGRLKTSITANGRAYISVPAATVATDDSPFIGVTASAGTTLCYDTDIATLAANGTGVIDIYWSVGLDDVANSSVIIGSLSSGTPCLFDIPPGKINVEVTTAPGAEVGEIRLQGNGGSSD